MPTNSSQPYQAITSENTGGMQLATKIKLGLVTLMLLFALNVASTLFSSKTILGNIASSIEAREAESANNSIFRDSFNLRRLVQSYSFAGNESTADRIRQIISRLEKEINTSLSQTPSPEVRYHLETMLIHLKGYQQRFEEVAIERKLRQELVAQITTNIRETRSHLLETVRSSTEEGNRNQPARESFQHLSSAEIQILRYLADPSMSIARSVQNDLESALAATGYKSQDGQDTEASAEPLLLEATASSLKQLQSDFRRVVQATRGYLYLVNVVMAGEASEFAYHSTQIETASQHQFAAISARTADRSQRASWVSIMLGSLAAIGALLLGGILLREVIQPITAITETLSRLARGESVESIPGLDRQDEIGQMSQAANIFSQKNEETEQLLLQAQQLSSELNQQAQRLAKSNRELDAFAYVASHDLKSPLRGIDNLTTFLTQDLGDQIPPDSQEHIRLLKDKVKLMEDLLNDLLSYSRAGKTEQDVELIDTKELLEEIQRTIDWPDEMQLVIIDPMPDVVTDRTALRQVLQNLLTNAVKYRGSDAPCVTISAQDLGQQFKFRVSDNGPGIAPEYHDKVFQMFQRLQSREEVEGSGMGLPIIKKLVQNYGGVVTLDSDVGRGATFDFTWSKADLLDVTEAVEPTGIAVDSVS